MGLLRSNEPLQSKVDKRLTKLERINETAPKGRNKSQRGDPEDVSVKKDGRLASKFYSDRKPEK